MSWFRRIWESPADVDRVQAEVRRLADALVRQDEHAKQVEDALAAQPDAAALAGRVDALAETLADKGEHGGLAELATRIDTLADRIDTLETRLTSVSTELANQLSELGNEIDSLQQRPPETPIAEESIDELRDTQTRLANEQVRYQIAFREDLARLAEQLRRPPDPRARH